VLTKEFKAIRCDLLLFTKAAIALIPSGVFLGKKKVIEQPKGLVRKFVNVGLGDMLKVEKVRDSYAVGAPIELSIEARDAVPKESLEESKKPGAKLPMKTSGFTVFIIDGPERIELDAEQSFIPIEGNYTTNILFQTGVILSEEKLASDQNYALLISRILKKKQEYQIGCCFAQDFSDIRDTGLLKLRFPQPVVKTISITIPQGKQVAGMTDTIIIDFTTLDIEQENLSLYLHAWEVDVKSNIIYLKRPVKNRNRMVGYFEPHQLAANRYGCGVNLGEMIIEGNPIYEGDYYELSFSISLDKAGKYPLVIMPGYRATETSETFSAITRIKR